MSLVRLNDRNDVVKSLQRLLKDKGYNIYPDGIFGKKTEQAVRLFQQKNGLHADGIVGRKTWAALGKKIATPPPPPPIMGSPGRQNTGALRLSTSGLKMLFKFESQVGVSSHLHWPGGSSGVTLGAGYDMGARSKNEIITKLVSIGIAHNVATEAAEAAGKTGHDAKEFAKEHKKLISLTKEQEIDLLKLTVPYYERQVRNKMTIALTQYEFDALVSFAYNPGGALSKVTSFINQGKVGEAMHLIKLIVNSGGVKMKGLVDRRQHEVELFLEGKYSL